MEAPHVHSPSVAESMESHMEPLPLQDPTALGRLNERALDLVRERPIACLVGALAFGFVVGKLASRV